MAKPIIQISAGHVQGIPSEFNENVTVYKGIPFAANTTGENRWRAPQPPSPWEGVRIADTFGPVCPQIGFGPKDVISPLPQSEDCLSLNIWTPANPADEKLPVFVWIYGGRFLTGSGSDGSYDGSGLASKNLIVVSLNYRVGILGFLAHPELSEESGHNASGNYGILDQIAALKWVKDNIAAFGGDSAKVTVGGQSAGGASTAIHVSSPLSRGLFRSAINESGYRYPRDPLLSGLSPAYRTKEKAERQGADVLKEKGVSTIGELRKLSLEFLLENNNKNDDAWGNPPFYRPCIDGWVLQYNFEESLERAILADVPILTGHNADEGGTYNDPLFSEDDFKSCAKQKYGALSEKFMELYPISDTVTALQAWNEAARDNSRVTVSLWADEFHKSNKSTVFGYFFTHAPPSRSPSLSPSGPVIPDAHDPKTMYEKASARSQYTYSKSGPGPRGVYHSAEIPYILNNLNGKDANLYRDKDREVAKLMSTYWANFIKSGGDPNGEGVPKFVPTDSETIMRLGLEKDSSPVPLAANPGRVAFWKEHLAAQKPW